MKIVTTNDGTVGRDLRAALALREGVPYGLTWGDLKHALELLGVTDGDRIASIELGCKSCGSGRIVRDDAPDGIEIREV